MVSKSQQKREETMAQEKPEELKPSYRYFCDACTGIAGYAKNTDSAKQITCAACGKTQTCKKENWIKI